MPRKKAVPESDAPDREAMLSLDEAADALGVSRSTLYRWQSQGRLRGFKVGRQWRFRRSDLDKFSQMTHPSAADVNPAEVGALLSEAGASEEDAARLVVEPAVPGYPTTEEEKAVDRLLRSLLISAADAEASDIHIDPQRDGTTVRLRIDGVLHETMRLPRTAHDALVACIKVHADIPLDQRHTPQDGRFHIHLDGPEHDIRTATIPAIYGESVVMRLLVQEAALFGLDRMGMDPADRERYERALRQPVGLVLVTGPTGSGKTTLLYSGLHTIANPEVKTITVEDPVEYAFRHMTQTGVNKRSGYTFEAAQRAIMRHDPDIVMVGEIRSLESAELALQAAITGHLVISQLHVTSAPRAVTRLFDMGIEPFMLAQALLYVSAQRLIRNVCPECAQRDEPDFSLLSPLAERARAGGYPMPDNPRFMRGAGCDNCRQTGYRNRTGLYEVMEVNREIGRLIAARASERQIEEAAIRNGMTTLAADGLRKAAAGITSVAEALRVLPD